MMYPADKSWLTGPIDTTPLTVGLEEFEQLVRDGVVTTHPPGWTPPPISADDFMEF